jgi:AraC-like DNA-binding protein
MPIERMSSGRVITDGDSLPALKQVVASGPSEAVLGDRQTGEQPEDASPRRDPPAAPRNGTGSEQRYPASWVERSSYAGGLPQTSLRRVLEHMEAHLDQELPVTALAVVAQMSPFYFSRLFKQSTGLSPHQYLLRQRIERARELLTDPRRRVAEVGYELGFPKKR